MAFGPFKSVIFLWTSLAALFWSFALTAGPVEVGADLTEIDLVKRMTYLVDGKSELTDPGQINPASQPFVARDDANFGVFTGTVWGLFDIVNTSAKDMKTVIVFRYPLLRRITFFDLTPGGTRTLHDYNLERPFVEKPLRNMDVAFPVELEAGAHHTFAFRVACVGECDLSAKIAGEGTYETALKEEYIAYFALIGAIMVLFVYYLLYYIYLRQTNLLWYLLYLGGAMGDLLVMSGLGFEFVWPNLPIIHDNVLTMSGILGAAAVGQLTRKVLDLDRLTPRWSKVIFTIVCLMGLSLIVVAFGQLTIKYVIVVAGACCVILASLVGMGLAFRLGSKPAKPYSLGWIVMLLFTLYFIAGLFGYTAQNALTRYSIFIGCGWQLVFFSLSIAGRLHEIEQSYTRQLQKKNDELNNFNQALEEKVRERTDTIKRITDNVSIGLFLLNRAGNVLEGYSKSCERILGSRFQAGVNFAALFIEHEKTRMLFSSAISQVFDEIFSEDVSLQQFPKRVEYQTKILALDGSIIRNSTGSINHILFAISDVTKEEANAKLIRNDYSVIRIFRYRQHFINFLRHFREDLTLCESLATIGEHDAIRRKLHTLKSDALVFGMEDVHKIIHDSEDIAQFTRTDLQRIAEKMADFLDDNFEFLQISFDGRTKETCVIETKELLTLADWLKVTDDLPTIKANIYALIDRIQLTRAAEVIDPLISSGKTYAARLGKQVTFRAKGREVLLDLRAFNPVINNLNHLISNAIFHGIELAGERSKHKPRTGVVEIEISENPTCWTIEIKDDGRGIDVNGILQKAMQKGALSREQVMAMNDDERLAAILEARVSTIQEQTATAGRGIGLNAANHVIRELGGTMAVFTQKDRGTHIMIRLPKKSVKSNGLPQPTAAA